MRSLLFTLIFLAFGSSLASAKDNCKAIDAAISTQEDFVEIALVKGIADASVLSLAAMEKYKVLVELHQASLPTILPVAMLDYTGFKFRALMVAPSTDWQTVSATRDVAVQNWQIAQVGLADKALIDLMAHTFDGLGAAIDQQNVKWVDNMSQILLDSVDLLELQIHNPAKGACH